MAHIVAEDQVTEKRGRPRRTGRPQPMRVHEAIIEKKDSVKQQLMEEAPTPIH